MTPTVVAHRGFAGVNPENTVAAVRAAADRADSVEIDVVACADGTPVVFHDARLDSGGHRSSSGRPQAAAGKSRGITDGTGAIRDLPPETVTAATVRGSGEPIPTLDRLLDATSVPLDVELKRPASAVVRRGVVPTADRAAARDRWQPFVNRVCDALDADGREARLSSFCEGALAAVREYTSTRPLAPLCRDLTVGRELAARYDADAIHPSLTAVREAASVPRERTVNVWTIRTWFEARAAVDAGADGLIADYPGLTQWL
ncbi:MAG: glycerophosphodiester phosphodiesterase [Haloplanus sp.]